MENSYMTPKRSLGQNFFINKRLAEKIVSIVTKTKPQTVIEIGPGKGAFTQLFLKTTTQKVIAIEKDDALSVELRQKYPTLDLIHTDVLMVDLSALLMKSIASQQHNNQNTTPFQLTPAKAHHSSIVVFGSLPYNLSKRIITFSLNAMRNVITEALLKKSKYKEPLTLSYYFIIQKEVAQKYIGLPHSNPLSLLMQLVANIKILFDIKPDSFSPRPKVTSSLIHISPHPENLSTYADVPYEEFRDFIIGCFQHPRKTLKNNLEVKKGFNLNEFGGLLEKRPHELNLKEYVMLYKSGRIATNKLS